jgi:hypothetical protein
VLLLKLSVSIVDKRYVFSNHVAVPLTVEIEFNSDEY